MGSFVPSLKRLDKSMGLVGGNELGLGDQLPFCAIYFSANQYRIGSSPSLGGINQKRRTLNSGSLRRPPKIPEESQFHGRL